MKLSNLYKDVLNEESLLENYGYRDGDVIGRKPEQRGNFSLGGRHTGHFGTGYYFYGNKADADRGERVTTEIPLDGYNLAKGTLTLHELLKDVNNYTLGAHKDHSRLSRAIDSILKYFKVPMEPIPKITIQIRNDREWDAATPEERDKSKEEFDAVNDTYRRNAKKSEDIADMVHASEGGEDAPSTVVMKALGFEGVDSRGTELDNGVYGSVVYDIK